MAFIKSQLGLQGAVVCGAAHSLDRRERNRSLKNIGKYSRRVVVLCLASCVTDNSVSSLCRRFVTPEIILGSSNKQDALLLFLLSLLSPVLLVVVKLTFFLKVKFSVDIACRGATESRLLEASVSTIYSCI